MAQLRVVATCVAAAAAFASLQCSGRPPSLDVFADQPPSVVATILRTCATVELGGDADACDTLLAAARQRRQKARQVQDSLLTAFSFSQKQAPQGPTHLQPLMPTQAWLSAYRLAEHPAVVSFAADADAAGSATNASSAGAACAAAFSASPATGSCNLLLAGGAAAAAVSGIPLPGAIESDVLVRNAMAVGGDFSAPWPRLRWSGADVDARMGNDPATHARGALQLPVLVVPVGAVLRVQLVPAVDVSLQAESTPHECLDDGLSPSSWVTAAPLGGGAAGRRLAGAPLALPASMATLPVPFESTTLHFERCTGSNTNNNTGGQQCSLGGVAAIEFQVPLGSAVLVPHGYSFRVMPQGEPAASTAKKSAHSARFWIEHALVDAVSLRAAVDGAERSAGSIDAAVALAQANGCDADCASIVSRVLQAASNAVGATEGRPSSRAAGTGSMDIAQLMPSALPSSTTLAQMLAGVRAGAPRPAEPATPAPEQPSIDAAASNQSSEDSAAADADANLAAARKRQLAEALRNRRRLSTLGQSRDLSGTATESDSAAATGASGGNATSDQRAAGAVQTAAECAFETEFVRAVLPPRDWQQFVGATVMRAAPSEPLAQVTAGPATSTSQARGRAGATIRLRWKWAGRSDNSVNGTRRLPAFLVQAERVPAPTADAHDAPASLCAALHTLRLRVPRTGISIGGVPSRFAPSVIEEALLMQAQYAGRDINAMMAGIRNSVANVTVHARPVNTTANASGARKRAVAAAPTPEPVQQEVSNSSMAGITVKSSSGVLELTPSTGGVDALPANMFIDVVGIEWTLAMLKRLPSLTPQIAALIDTAVNISSDMDFASRARLLQDLTLDTYLIDTAHAMCDAIQGGDDALLPPSFSELLRTHWLHRTAARFVPDPADVFGSFVRNGAGVIVAKAPGAPDDVESRPGHAASDANAAIEHVQLHTDCDADDLLLAAERGATYCVDVPAQMLGTGSLLRFRVAADDDLGASLPGPFSAPLYVPPLPRPRTAPTQLTARITGEATASLAWLHPAADPASGLPVLGFLVEMDEKEDGQFYHPLVVPAASATTAPPGGEVTHTVAVHGLVSRIVHRFRVAAVTATGVGDFSAVSDAVMVREQAAEERSSANGADAQNYTTIAFFGSRGRVVPLQRECKAQRGYACTPDGAGGANDKRVAYTESSFDVHRLLDSMPAHVAFAQIANLHAAASAAFSSLALCAAHKGAWACSSAYADRGIHASGLLERSGLGVGALDVRFDVLAAGRTFVGAFSPNGRGRAVSHVTYADASPAVAASLWPWLDMLNSTYVQSTADVSLRYLVQRDLDALLLPGVGGLHNFAVARSNRIDSVRRLLKEVDKDEAACHASMLDMVCAASQFLQWPGLASCCLRLQGAAPSPPSRFLQAAHLALGTGRVVDFVRMTADALQEVDRIVDEEATSTAWARRLRVAEGRTTMPVLSGRKLSGALSVELNVREHLVRLLQTGASFPSWSSAWVDGMHLDNGRVVGELVFSDPPAGSRPGDLLALPLNTQLFEGKVVVFERGQIPLAEKVRRAQDAHAIGVIIVDDAGDRCHGNVFSARCVPGSDLARRQGFGSSDDPTAWAGASIPAMLVTYETGHQLLQHFARVG